MIPDPARCRELMSREGMLDNIVSHSLKVAGVCLFLAEALKERSILLDIELVHAAALLHDITKTRSIHTGENHAKTGARRLEELGYPELAPLVANHICPPEPLIDEVNVLNYADKRVMHDEVVSLRVRFDDLDIRYGYTPSRQRAIAENLKKSLEFERMLFDGLDITPESLLYL